MITELLLLYIVKKVGLFKKLKTTTVKISKELNVSQQTISRTLKKLEDMGLIRREVSPVGVVISLERKAVSMLKKRYSSLKQIFEKKVSLKGKVVEGIGEGKYYVKIYSKKFEHNLGFKPFLGTLNIEVDPAKAKEFMINPEDILIDGFKDGSRTYGAVQCYKIIINNKIEGALIIP
ncbi:DUF120 domain-containing protein, partial [Candidatus Woesearchaeota archaeon]|nr:DUF120 domain-containing protein [Candidatus Woesearchaeota archaeon]